MGVIVDIAGGGGGVIHGTYSKAQSKDVNAQNFNLLPGIFMMSRIGGIPAFLFLSRPRLTLRNAGRLASMSSLSC